MLDNLTYLYLMDDNYQIVEYSHGLHRLKSALHHQDDDRQIRGHHIPIEIDNNFFH